MELTKLGLLSLSVILNFFLLSEIKKINLMQSNSFNLMAEKVAGLSSAVNKVNSSLSVGTSTSTSPAVEVSDSKLNVLVNQIVRDEMHRIPKETVEIKGNDRESAQVKAMLATVTELQKKVAEKVAAIERSESSDRRENSCRDELNRVKEEVLAQCRP